ncbi:hypothetical protein AWB83_04122 [Caballeronia ptereochthonis]|uniref:Uncharacterized protein n=1 Tax=Caballeronia ptereochthonis TaxID=1777144 RepID=A0A158C966_9BURK|nr:hypothetical protein AWB83_04122 [Caballeronia ptereochthonis]
METWLASIMKVRCGQDSTRAGDLRSKVDYRGPAMRPYGMAR